MPQFKIHFILVAAMGIWGISWAASKVVSNFNLLWTNGFRLTLAGCFLLGIARLKGQAKITHLERWPIFRSILLIFAYNLVYLFGLRFGKAGSGGMIVTSINPLFVWLFLYLAAAFNSQSLSIDRWSFIGLLCGLISVVFFIADPIFIIAGGIWALISINSRTSNLESNAFTGYSFLGTGLLSFAIAPATGPIPNLSSGNYLDYLLALGYLSLISSGFATWSYFYYVKKLGSRIASQYTFLVPAFAMIFSWLWLGEVPELNTIIGGVFSLLAAILLIFKGKR